jgi:pyrroloquinoline-quinone synthase
MRFDGSQVEARLNGATEDVRILNHPFYKAWAAGELSTEDLSFYATQYWRQVESFPGYLETIASRLPSSHARGVVLENLADEVDGDHLGLWLEFADGVGASRDSVLNSEIAPETAECVASFKESVAQRSVAFALGMIYGYESQTPEVAETKVKGLREFYGIEGPALEYFELHGSLDIEHSGELAVAISEIAKDEQSLAEAEAGARAGADAIWKLLDGVSRVREICPA